MKLIKLIAATAVAISSTLLPIESKATGQHTLLYELERAGVSVSLGRCSNPMMLGFFQKSTMTIGICKNNMDTRKQMDETLRHEAVHVAQHCVDPSMKFTVTPSSYILNNSDKDDWEFIQLMYPAEHHAIELEAFTLMRATDSQVANIVRGACNS